MVCGRGYDAPQTRYCRRLAYFDCLWCAERGRMVFYEEHLRGHNMPHVRLNFPIEPPVGSIRSLEVNLYV